MTQMINLIGREFSDLTVKRDLYGDGTMFHAICKCDRYRTVTREQLLSKVVKACHTCAKAARHAANRPQVEVIPVEPLVKIDPVECSGLCTWRLLEIGWRLGADPDCPAHSPMFGNAGHAYPRSTLTASSSIGGGRAIYSHRKAGMANE